MAQYVYKGLTQAERDALVKAHMKGVTPPESRGQPSKYRIDKDDSEEVREEKRKAKTAWLKAREKEIDAEVEAIDKAMVLMDVDKKVVFEKAKPVTVADGSDIAKRLDALCGIGKKVTSGRIAWEKVEKVEKVEPQKKG